MPQEHGFTWSRFEHEQLPPVLLNGFRVFYAQPGAAEGSLHWRTRGLNDLYAEITCWPRHAFRLTTGRALELHILDISKLWPQEIYVYLREFGEAIKEALDNLKVRDRVESECRYCSGKFSYIPGTGRPRLYCSDPCLRKGQAANALKKRMRKLEANA